MSMTFAAATWSAPVASADAPSPAPAHAGSDVHAVDAIVVTGSRTERPLGDAPVATQVISQREIAESGAQNLAELLEEQPGIYLDRSFAGAGLQLQGLPADYTLILVDGVRQPGRIDGTLDLERFSIEDIERVEIVRGASSALYGSDAIAGVVNLISRKARKPLELDGQLSLGAYETLDASAAAGLARESWSTRLSAGHHSSSGFDLDPSNVATTQPASTQYNIASQNRLSPARGLTLNASADYRHRDRQGVDISAAGGAVFDRHNLTETASILMKPEWQLGSGSRLELRGSLALFRDQFLLDQRASDALDQVQDTRERLLQLGTQVDVRLGSAQLLSIGTEVGYETLQTERLVDGRGERTRLALYAQDEWRVFDAPVFVFLPGARLDVDSQFGAYVTPRAALRFDPTSALTLRASYGLGFKAPDFRELYLLFENPSAGYLVEGNPALEPETSRNLNGGAEYRPHRAIWLSAQAFYNDLSQRIGTDLVPSDDVGPQRFRYRNVSSASTRGVELAVRVSPLPGLRLDASYAWTQTNDEVDDRPLSGQPLHRATASVRYRVPSIGFETTCRGAFVGSRPFFQDTDADGQTEQRDAAGYASVDVRVSQDIGYGVSSFLLAENLLDAGDAEFLPIQPRNFSGGLRLAY
jgi:outer membrane receptor for ferrienterochelin and colicins